MRPLRLAAAICLAICLVLGLAAPAAFAQDKSPYMKECEDKDVPLPPKWGDPAWRKLKQDLPAETSFDTGTAKYVRTEVWVYANDKGTCMALPRIGAAGIELLGMICQGKTGNACFWDNIPTGKGEDERIKGNKTKGMDPAKLRGGNDLEEPCDECHRGRNAFVVHPGTSLDPSTWGKDSFVEPPAKEGGKTEAKPETPPPTVTPPPGGAWYTPVSSQGWVNPKGTLKLSKSGCNDSSCHTLPKLTARYCSLLAREIGVTMPADAPNDDPPIVKGKWRDKRFEGDVATLRKGCKEAGYPRKAEDTKFPE